MIFCKKLTPFLIQRIAVRLQCVGNRNIFGIIFLFQTNTFPEKIQPCQRRFPTALRGRSRQIKHFLKEWAGAGLYSMADALLRKMSGARERQSGRRIRFIFCAFILLRLYLAGNIGLLFRKVQSHCAEMASDTKRPCRSEQRQLSVLIRQGHSDGPDEAEAVSTLSRSLAPTPLTVTPQIF